MISFQHAGIPGPFSIANNTDPSKTETPCSMLRCVSWCKADDETDIQSKSLRTSLKRTRSELSSCKVLGSNMIVLSLAFVGCVLQGWRCHFFGAIVPR